MKKVNIIFSKKFEMVGRKRVKLLEMLDFYNLNVKLFIFTFGTKKIGPLQRG